MSPCEYDHKDQTMEPGIDLNAPSPAIPADHQPATPEFLQELIRELDDLRQRDSEIWADMYPMSRPGTPPKVPPYIQREQAKRESEEIQKKMAALQARIHSLRILIAAQPPAQPELDKAAPAQAPTDAATQAEVLKGPAFPLQRPSEPFTPVEVPHSHTVPGRHGGVLRPAHPSEQPPRR